MKLHKQTVLRNIQRMAYYSCYNNAHYNNIINIYCAAEYTKMIMTNVAEEVKKFFDDIMKFP